MAVEYINYSLVQDSDATVSSNVTVPSDATFVALLMVGFDSSTNWVNPSTFTLGGSAFTNVVDTDGQTSNGQVWIGYLFNQSTGTQTFAGSISSYSPDEGMTYCLAYFKGVNTSSPILDSESQTTSGTTVSSLTTGTGSMTAGCVYAYSSTILSANTNSQTLIANGIYNTASYSVAYKAESSTWQYTNPNYSTCAAISIKAGSGEAPGNPWYYYAQQMRQKLEEKLKRRIVIPGFADCMRYGFVRYRRMRRWPT